MKTPLLLSAAALLALAACVAREGGDDQKGVKTPPVLAGVPVPRYAQIVDTVGTADAARAVLLVAMPADSVSAFYRRELPKAGFRIVGDVGDSLGVDLYAQRDGPPLWVQVRRGNRPDITRFTIIGAVGGARPPRDSAGRDPLH